MLNDTDSSALQDNVQSRLTDIAKKLEHKRKSFQNILLIALAVLIGGLIIVAYPFDFSAPGGLVLLIIMAIIPALLLYHGLNYFYRRQGKTLFIKALSEATGFAYNPEGIFPVSAAAHHKIFPPFHREHHEDGFEGYYRNIAVSVQETRLSDFEQEPRQARARRSAVREHIVFNGLIIRLRIPKPMGGHTVVMPSSALQTYMRTRFSDFSPVKLVSNKFSKKYDVMSTDQIEARVILNPAFMERFMEARKILNAKWAEVSFLDSEIMFAVARTRPLFEPPPLWRPVTAQYLERLAAELLVIFKIIDVLKLNPQTGL